MTHALKKVKCTELHEKLQYQQLISN